MPIRLIIADDHPLLIDGVRAVIEEMDDVVLLDSVTNGRQLMDRLLKQLVDMVLLDLNMPHLDGISTLTILKERQPHLKVIIFTSYDQPKLIKEIKSLGADGYLLKTSSSSVLKEAIIAVAAGATWFPDEVVASSTPELLIDDFTIKYQITKREVEIIRLIVQGFSTRQIGERLFISEFTVNSHRRNIARKLGIDTPIGLLNFAKEQGLI
ncbi:response regulator transcription factor [Spirosoma sp. KCTC 42546]|uniref:response regulator n=1 Tax=Spirosoma sp. KCTC 42546 TaxID=2520506 RepID=UPI0011575337|nr:response regulator transcription factor [Spirosoma sp. KCTC 42546]QDK79257.1 response regulator transcription factor [Spirosoma sp. KCTC 42546]